VLLAATTSFAALATQLALQILAATGGEFGVELLQAVTAAPAPDSCAETHQFSTAFLIGSAASRMMRKQIGRPEQESL